MTQTGNGVAYSIQAPGPHGPGYRLAGSPISCRQLKADAGTIQHARDILVWQHLRNDVKGEKAGPQPCALLLWKARSCGSAFPLVAIFFYWRASITKWAYSSCNKVMQKRPGWKLHIPRALRSVLSFPVSERHSLCRDHKGQRTCSSERSANVPYEQHGSVFVSPTAHPNLERAVLTDHYHRPNFSINWSNINNR